MRKLCVTSKIYVLGFLLVLTSCFNGPGLFQQKKSASDVAVETNENGGIISGAFRAGSNVVQTLTASGAITGSSVSFPPGSLSIDTEIFIEEGASIAGFGASSQLGISAMSQAGPSVVVSASASIDAASPFTLQIPLSSAGLHLGSNENLIVMYKTIHAATGEYYMGFFTYDQLKIEGSFVKFETTYFGSYQAAYTEVKETRPKQIPSATPILTKAAEADLAPIEWILSAPLTDPSARTVGFPVRVRGFDSLRSCAVSIHNSKTGPSIHTSNLGSPGNMFNGVTHTHAAGTNSEVTLYARYSCEDRKGRFGQSPWSDAATLAAVVVPADTTSTIVADVTWAGPGFSVLSSVAISIQWSRTGIDPSIVGYYISWAEGAVNTSCNTGNFKHLGAVSGTFQKEEIRPLKKQQTYTFNVCAFDAGYNRSPGKTLTATTGSDTVTLANASTLCDGGTNFSTPTTGCLINTEKFLASNEKISGDGNLTITANGKISGLGNSSTNTIDIRGTLSISGNFGIFGSFQIYANDINVGVGTVISANGKGSPGGVGGSTPGDGIGVFDSGGKNGGSVNGGGGGGHGGSGGIGSNSPFLGGFPHGSVDWPVSLGGGGGGALGAGSTGKGGAGGGRLLIVVHGNSAAAGSIVVDGDILANGENGESGTTDCSGGGAGGSIILKATGVISGAGNISANGGSGIVACGGGHGGGGSGGRIAFYASSRTHSGSILAVGGDGNNGTGAAGTIFTEIGTQISTLANNNTFTPYLTLIDFTKFSRGNLGEVVIEYANVRFEGLQGSNIIKSLTLGPSAAINHSGLGYAGGLPTQHGIGNGGSNLATAGAGQHGSSGGGGGAHKGNGSSAAGVGGDAFGDIANPTTRGAGGGSSTTGKGGNGGGAIVLNILQTVDIGSGSYIKANGLGGSSPGGGGGAGGSIWIKASSFSGSGTIEAKGGYGESSGGHGGGGMIKLQRHNLTDPSYSGGCYIDAGGSGAGVGLAQCGAT